MSKSINFEVIQGDSFNLDVTYTNEDGSPFNLTGYDIVFTVRNEPGGKIICATCNLTDGITLTSALNGQFTINVSGTKSKKFTLPKAHFQCQISTSDINKKTILQGWFAVEKSTI